MALINLTNDFHNTSATIRAEYGQKLTPARVRKIRRKLCPVSGCTCGGPLGERGWQPYVIEAYADGVKIWLRGETSWDLFFEARGRTCGSSL